MPTGPSGTNWEFDGFKVMRERRLLIAGGTPVPLTSKAFDTLVVLIENRDRVVTKDELLRSVWPDVEVEEGNLTQQIFLLRKALGESAQQPRAIVTIPGHGYRFAASVSVITADQASSVAPGSTSTPPIPRGRGPWVTAAAPTALGLVVLLAIVLGAPWMRLSTPEPALDLTKARITRVTENGKAPNAAISPDGRFVAYVENDGDEYSAWVKQISTGGKTQVVPRQPQMVAHLTFSRDGEYLYFVRGTMRRGGFKLFRVPAIGGLETAVLDNVDTPVSFSPDGREFAFMRGAGSETHIVLADARGGSERILATRKNPLAFSFVAPDWSPDGAVVAASATDQSNGWRSSIVLLPLDHGASRDLYSSDSRIGRVRWLPDQSGLLLIVSETLSRQFAPWLGSFAHFSGGSIWHVTYPGGRAEQLTSDLTEHDLCCLDVSENRSRVASVVNSLVSDLWIAAVDHLDTPRQITSGNPVVSRHGWLADNDTIVYRDLNGHLNAVHKDGRAFSVRVPDGHKVVGGVSTCGDRRYVIFQAVPGNNIWRVTPDAGHAVRLTSGGADSNPACSPDGKWAIYSSMNKSLPSLWRVSIDGGKPTIVQTESYDALPSPSGRLIYYAAFEWEQGPPRLRVLRWKIVSSTNLTRLFSLDAPSAATQGTLPMWAPDESGLDYVVTRNGVSNIWRQPLTGAPPVQITHFSTGKIFSFAWSPDGRWLSLASGINRSDVVLMSNEP